MRVRLEKRRVDERGWVLPAAVLVVFVAGALADLRCAPSVALAPEGQAFVGAAVAPRLGPGDALFVAPPAAAPALAAALARPVYAGFPPAPPSALDGAARVTWLLAEDGAQAPRGGPRWTPAFAEVAAGDGWRLARLALPAGAPREAVVADLWAALDRAEAAVVRDGKPRPCAREPEGRLRCGPDDWNFVGPYVAAAGGAPRRCLWAHPVSGAVLRVRFPAVPFGPGRTLRGGYGLIDGTPDGAAVQLRVLVGDAVRLRQTIPGKASGWRPFSLKAERDAAAAADLVFELETGDNRWRTLCLDAVVVGPAPEEAAPPSTPAAAPGAGPAAAPGAGPEAAP